MEMYSCSELADKPRACDLLCINDTAKTLLPAASPTLGPWPDLKHTGHPGLSYSEMCCPVHIPEPQEPSTDHTARPCMLALPQGHQEWART